MDVAIACPCPGTPHEGDTVTLADRLGLRAGTAIQQLVIEAIRASEDRLDQADIIGLLTEGYLLYGIERWTLVDAKRKPIEVTKDAIRTILLSDYALARPVSEAADDLYQQAVISPLVERARTSSPDTPTNGSTSATPSVLPLRPSKRSSTTTTPTGGTATTSRPPAGDSSSLRSSASAGS